MKPFEQDGYFPAPSLKPDMRFCTAVTVIGIVATVVGLGTTAYSLHKQVATTAAQKKQLQYYRDHPLEDPASAQYALTARFQSPQVAAQSFLSQKAAYDPAGAQALADKLAGANVTTVPDYSTVTTTDTTVPASSLTPTEIALAAAVGAVVYFFSRANK